MKKILATILILTFVFAGCSPKQETEPSDTQTAQNTAQTATDAPTEEATPTEAPTPTAEPEPTPDTDPKVKLMVTDEEFNELLKLWPVVSSPIEDHGTITDFSMNSQAGIDSSSLNFNFQPGKSAEDLIAFYQELVVGEWENSEYSAGPSVYGGLIEDTIKTTCQVATTDGETDVFLGMFIDEGSDELDALFDAHWPIGLISIHESLTEESLFFKRFELKHGVSLSFSESWETESAENVTKILDYYKDLLAGEEKYEYFEGGDYESAYVACEIEGITIKVSETMDTRIEIALTSDIE